MKEIKTQTNPPSFTWKKDVPLLLVLFLFLGLFLFFSFKTPETNSSSYCEIRYDGTILHPKDYQESDFAFPSQGEEKITLTKGKEKDYGYSGDFGFQCDNITITLYFDHSIQIKEGDIVCNDHTCTRMGRVYVSYTPIVCLPNHLQVMIVENGLPEFDA